VITDPCSSIKPSLYIGLSADEDSVANFERLQVFEAYVRTNASATPESLGNSPPDCSPHDRVKFALAARKPNILFNKLSR
jgi:hypothetical protein